MKEKNMNYGGVLSAVGSMSIGDQHELEHYQGINKTLTLVRSSEKSYLLFLNHNNTGYLEVHARAESDFVGIIDMYQKAIYLDTRSDHELIRDSLSVFVLSGLEVVEMGRRALYNIDINEQMLFFMNTIISDKYLPVILEVLSVMFESDKEELLAEYDIERVLSGSILSRFSIIEAFESVHTPDEVISRIWGETVLTGNFHRRFLPHLKPSEVKDNSIFVLFDDPVKFLMQKYLTRINGEEEEEFEDRMSQYKKFYLGVVSYMEILDNKEEILKRANPYLELNKKDITDLEGFNEKQTENITYVDEKSLNRGVLSNCRSFLNYNPLNNELRVVYKLDNNSRSNVGLLSFKI